MYKRTQQKNRHLLDIKFRLVYNCDGDNGCGGQYCNVYSGTVIVPIVGISAVFKAANWLLNPGITYRCASGT